MHIGLYFGSFNPIHNGHIAIAQAMYSTYKFNEIWLVISPNSPFKNYANLAEEHLRLHMVELAIENYPYMKACTIEFNMPKPNYTYATLRQLALTYPTFQFSIIMGGDNIAGITKWKNYEEIMQNYSIYVYPREHESITDTPKNIIFNTLPLLNISATKLRKKLKNGEDCSNDIPTKTLQYIINQHIY